MTIHKKTIKSPRPHQKEAIDKAIEHFKKWQRGILSMCCGSGKTLTSLWIAQKLKAKRILVLVPTLNLQSQLLGSWLEELRASNMHHHVICIGSDSTIGKEHGILSTTSQEVLNQFLEDHPYAVVISTYKSNHLIAQTGQSFDFAIYDEAHETAGKKDKEAALLLSDEDCKIKNRLFVTATPKNVINRKGKDEAVSMDKVEIYGETIYQLSYGDGIEKGIVGDYEVLMLCHPNKKQLEKDLEGLYNEEKFSVHYVNMAYAYVKELAKGERKLNKVISYHKDNNNALAFSYLCKRIAFQCFPELDFKVFNLTHESNDKQKRAVLKEFEECENGLLTNCRLFNTGYDLPVLNGVLLADPTQNTIGIVQVHGRQGRLHESKEKGYFILPIEKVEEEYRFETSIYVLAALAKNDDSLFHNTYCQNYDTRKLKTKNRINFIDKDLKLDKLNYLFNELYIKTNNILRRMFMFWDLEMQKDWLSSKDISSPLEYKKYKQTNTIPTGMPFSLYGYLRNKGLKQHVMHYYFDKSDKNFSIEEIKSYLHENDIKSVKEFNDTDKAMLPDNFPKDLNNYLSRKTSIDESASKVFFCKENTDNTSIEEIKEFLVSKNIKTHGEFIRANKDGFPKKIPISLRGYIKRNKIKSTPSFLFFNAYRHVNLRSWSVEKVKSFISENEIKTLKMYLEMKETLPQGMPLNLYEYLRKRKIKGTPTSVFFPDGYKKDYWSVERIIVFLREKGIIRAIDFRKFDKSNFPKQMPKSLQKYLKSRKINKTVSQVFFNRK